MKRILGVGLGFAVLLVLAQGAAAEPLLTVRGAAPNDRGDSVVREATVRYDDLNLAVTADAKALYERIEAAAAAVCRFQGKMKPSRTESDRVEKCRSRATANAVAGIDAPELTQLAAGQ